MVERHGRDAFGQHDVGQVQELVDLELGDIDLEKVRQMPRQAGDLDVAEQALDDTAFLDADGFLFANDPDRNVQRDCLVGDDAQKVDMQDLRPRRVSLHGLDDDGLAVLAEPNRQDVREEALAVHFVDQFVLAERDRPRVPAAAVDDCGDAPAPAQPPAAAAAQFIACFSSEFECHDRVPLRGRAS